MRATKVLIPMHSGPSHCPCDGGDSILPGCIQIGSPETAITAGSLNAPCHVTLHTAASARESPVHVNRFSSILPLSTCLLVRLAVGTTMAGSHLADLVFYIHPIRILLAGQKSLSAPHELSPLSLTSSSSLLFSSEPLAYSNLSPMLPIIPW